jgi:hypothetical protein
LTPIIGFIVVIILLLTKEYTFKENPLLKWTFIILGIMTLIIVALTILKKIREREKAMIGPKIPITPPIPVSSAFTALKEWMVLNGWVRAVIANKKIEPNEKDFEIGSSEPYWERDGVNWIKKIDLKLRLKGPNCPPHLLGTHKLEKVPLTSKKDILTQNFAFLNRAFTLRPDKSRRYYPQAIELTPQERQLGILERYPIPDIEELKRVGPKEEPDEVKVLREIARGQSELKKTFEETKKPAEEKE